MPAVFAPSRSSTHASRSYQRVRAGAPARMMIFEHALGDRALPDLGGASSIAPAKRSMKIRCALQGENLKLRPQSYFDQGIKIFDLHIRRSRGI